jgi:MFS family permease
MPDMAWAAWLFVGVAHVVITLIRGVLPSSGVACELTKPQLGLVFFLISAVQASMGLVLTRSRWWMYRPLPLLAFGAFGLIGLVLFSFAQTWGVFLLAAFCFGIYSGSFFFYFVFHSLVHPANSARYVSINEAVIGLTGAMGPILGGLVADHVGLNASYGVAVGLIVLVVVAQAIVHGRVWLQHRLASLP